MSALRFLLGCLIVALCAAGLWKPGASEASSSFEAPDGPGPLEPFQESPVRPDGGAAASGAGAPPDAVALRSFESSTECAACHSEVFAAWEESQHAIAWTNPVVQAQTDGFQNQNCIDCHAPRPIFTTGVGERVLPRIVRRAEGVDCISCHLLPDGRMAATRTVVDAPCRPVATPELSEPAFCAGCHNQHATVDQWRDSSWPERGQDCVSCHMPRGPDAVADGRGHAFPGADDEALLASAVELRGSRVEDRYVIEVENVGAGHAYPTDERSRSSDLFWRPRGEDAWRHLYRIRDPYRTETHLPRTALQAGETLRLELEESGPVEVALFYMRQPLWKDPENPDPTTAELSRLVHRIELAP